MGVFCAACGESNVMEHMMSTLRLKAAPQSCDRCGNGLVVRELSSGCADKVSHKSSPLLFPHPPLLQDLFVLLDLIGAPSPRFGNQFPATAPWLSRLQNIGE